MEFTIDSTVYTVERITAIAACDGGKEENRQDCLLVTDDDGTETAEYVVFGWEMPETEADFSEMSEDYSAWEPLDEDHKIKR